MAEYQKGDVVLFDGTPAVVIDVSAKYAGQLTISQFPGMSSIIGDVHSKLGELDGWSISPAFAERVAEIRAYYGMDTEPWVSRRRADVRGPFPGWFPEELAVYGMDYRPRVMTSGAGR